MLPEERNLAYVLDMVNAILAVSGFVRDIDMDAFLTDDVRTSAVKWQFIVIGEAANRLSTLFKETHSHIPWDSIRGLRNHLAHEYDRTDHASMWQTIQKDLPLLLDQLIVLVPDPPTSDTV
jgi:uncharacterized protein with HEPN domain